MMRKINHIEALELLKSGFSITDFSVEISQDKIEAIDALLLGENGVLIPADHIYYSDDDEIDFSDDPDIVEGDFHEKRLIKTRKINLKVSEDIHNWSKKSNVNLDILASKLVEDFYDNLKVVKETS